VIRARQLSRRFGDRRVIDRLDLDVAAGEFLLLTGPNGSGKTTLLRLVAGLLAPTGGTIEVDVDRGRVGFLGHDPLVYRELTPLENLELYGRLYRIPERRERIGALLERFGLWQVRNDRVSTFSRGMQQRLGLCRTLLHEPDLIVLDEPFNALDAAGSELLERELAGLAGRTVLLATHDPARVDPLATNRLAFA
jgi:heme ABC exporter ATP-binding subunit CcmA